MAKRQAKHPLEDNPFVDGLLDWMDSPEGQLSIEVSDELWVLMDDVHIDPQQRRLLWPDGQRLSIDQSVQRIQNQYPDFPPEHIAGFLISWIEQYAPKNYTPEQLDELDRLTLPWVDEYEQQLYSDE